MRVLVVGTRGQLATELQRLAPRTALTVLPPERVELSDASQVEALLERLRPDLVMNAAAYTAVDRAESERDRAYSVNADGPSLLAAWCQRANAALFHVSTDYVFDGRSPRPYVETDDTAPLNVYGASKLAGEQAIRDRLERHLILRTSWVFSAHGQNFVKTMLRLAGERDQLRVVSDQLGRPTAAAALARVMLELAERLATGNDLAWGTYHFANQGPTSWHGLADAVIELRSRGRSEKPPEVVGISSAEYPTPAKRPRNSVLDTRCFEQAFGIAPTHWQAELDAVVRELSQSA